MASGDMFPIDDPAYYVTPVEFELAAPYPNPFNSSTMVRVSLPYEAKLTVSVVNLLGREVAMLAAGEFRDAGNHHFLFNAGSLASGIYFVHATTNHQSAMQKVVLVR